MKTTKVYLMSLLAVGMIACGGKEETTNTIQMEQSSISGEGAEYISFTDELPTMSLVENKDFVDDGELYYNIMVKVPVKINKSANASRVYSCEMEIIDENGKSFTSYPLRLGYKLFDRTGEKELENLLSQPDGSTGVLTFVSSKNVFDEESGNNTIKEISKNAKGIRITKLNMNVKKEEPKIVSEEGDEEIPTSSTEKVITSVEKHLSNAETVIINNLVNCYNNCERLKDQAESGDENALSSYRTYYRILQDEFSKVSSRTMDEEQKEVYIETKNKFRKNLKPL